MCRVVSLVCVCVVYGYTSVMCAKCNITLCISSRSVSRDLVFVVCMLSTNYP